MIDVLATALIVASLVLAAWAAGTALRNRRIGRAHLVGIGVVEAVLLVQVAVAVVALIGGERPESLATFIGYLAASLLVLPVGAVFALTERGRWSGGVLAVAGCTLAVVVVRLQDIWGAAGG